MTDYATDYVWVAKIADLPLEKGKLVEIDDERIALFRLDDGIYAIADVCTHDGGPLVEGEVINGCQVKCPRHGARFDIRTGAALSMPAFRPTATFAVRVVGDDVWVASPA